MVEKGKTAKDKGFHAKDGWHFKRIDNGKVLIQKLDAAGRIVDGVVLDDAMWASVVASVSIEGERGLTFEMARTLHNAGAVYPQ